MDAFAEEIYSCGTSGRSTHVANNESTTRKAKTEHTQMLTEARARVRTRVKLSKGVWKPLGGFKSIQFKMSEF